MKDRQARCTWRDRAQAILKAVGLVVDRGARVHGSQVLGCAYPRTAAALSALARQGVSVLVNLQQRPHDPARLARFGMAEVHLPVKDFTAPTPEQLEHGVAAIERAVGERKTVAVHCGGGLGRTGTLLACYLVSRGWSAVEAIEHVRVVRPGSIETRAQLNAIVMYGQSRPSETDT